MINGPADIIVCSAGTNHTQSLNENKLQNLFCCTTPAHNLPAAESCGGNTSAPVCVFERQEPSRLSELPSCFACVTSHHLATARSEAPAVKRATYCKKILIRGRRSRLSEVTFPVGGLEGLPATAETLIVTVLMNWIWNESVRRLVSSSLSASSSNHDYY